MSRQDANALFARTSFLYGGNAAYIENLYAKYESDPSALDAEWRAFFQSLKDDRSDVVDALNQTGIGDGAPQRDTFGLSGREREVLIQIARGRTNREIGERLFISQKTVGVHVGNILAKLGVSGRVEAAAVAIRLGLTEGQ